MYCVSTFSLQSHNLMWIKTQTDVCFLQVKTASCLCYNSMAAIQFVRQWPRVNPLPLGTGSTQKVLKPES